VRFERIEIEAFGGLRDLDTGPEPLGSFVVVEGVNEAGKSSFFEMVVALLYGFYPASHERNPWAPWSGVPAAGRATFTLDRGGRAEVQRRLLSTPAGSVLAADREIALRNDTLELAAHVPLGIYRQVFALTLHELAILRNEGWDAVQDRLLGALGARDLRPARQVADELENEAGALWRTNRRGNQRVRMLGERIRELSYRRNALRDQERGLRDAHGELATLSERLERTRTEREQVRERLERARTLAPIRGTLIRISELKARAGPEEALEGIPAEPVRALEAAGHHVREGRAQSERLCAARETARRALEAFRPADRGVLELDAEIGALASRVGGAQADLVQLGQVRQEARDLRRRLESGLQPLGVEAGSAVDDVLGGLSVSLVRERVAEALSAREQLDGLEARASHPTSLARVPKTPWLLAGLLAGLLLIGLGAAGPSAWAIAAGAVVTAVSGAGLLARHLAGQDARPEPGAREAARARRTHADSALAEALGGLATIPTATTTLAALPATLERARELLGDLRERRAREAEIERRASELERGVATLAGRAGLPPSGDEVPVAATLHRLQAALADARAREREASDARRELARLDEAAQAAADDLDRRVAAHEALERRLAPLGEGDAEAGAREAEARLEARRRAAELRRELDREAHASDVRAAAELGDTDAGRHPRPDEVARLTTRERALTDEIETLGRNVLRLENEIERLSRRETLDALDGEIAALDEEMERLVRERDRLWVLARVIRDADRWVREEHQPELLRRAGTLLETLTGGRYDRIVVDGAGGAFRVRGPAVRDSVPVEPPLSTGTREQVYLALRLAVLDALDGQGERLPLVLDEVLVNWDRERRDRGLDTLADVSQGRQVFLLTCHEPVAHAAAARGARIVRLDAPSAP
jgi:uncharacterized protein YhaN